MNLPYALTISFAVLCSFVCPTAHAQAPSRTAFAVIIGNNHSLSGQRAELHYADDDAAKYFAMFQGIAEGHAYLLTNVDRDSARLFPQVQAAVIAPTRRELARIGRELTGQVRAVVDAGGAADLYFIYAGHGDVDRGQGYIELADGRFASADLEAWLRAIPFTRAHLILDSCNSFFMLATRKPGGRYYATSEDAARALSKRLPNVGVFLSTSADGDAFEWSDIQSGVFSHIVRSGLLGAADADGDGGVDYLELAAFVATATAEVPNPNMRPHVFARGPGGDDEVAIVNLAGRTRVREVKLEPGASARLRLRDRDGIPILDAHPEAGTALALSIPDDWAEGASLERSEEAGKPLTFALQDSGLELRSEPASVYAARGSADVFQRLFVRAYGPKAVAHYRAEAQHAVTPVFGVSQESAARMRLLLDQVASAERADRVVGATVSFSVGAVLGAVGTIGLIRAETATGGGETSQVIGYGVQAAVGAGVLLTGAWTLWQPGAGARLASDYREALGSNGDYMRAFALADDKLRDLAKGEALGRWITGIGGGVLSAVGGTMIVIGGAFDVWGHDVERGQTTRAATKRENARNSSVPLYLSGGSLLTLGAAWVVSAAFADTPVQRLATIWEHDPGHVQLRPSLALSPHDGSISLHGRF
jgi:hypothetical protein